MTNKELLFEKAKKDSVNSYSPYSHYIVSASILHKDGTIISGQNIENASFSLTMCAERCALFKSRSMGYKNDDIVALLIYTPIKDSIPYPCGACRQVMAELMNMDATVYVANDDVIEEHKVADFLPYSWELKQWNTEL